MLDQLTGAARLVELLMQATLVACFFHWKFSSQYRWFMTYITVELIRACVLLGLDNHSVTYAKAWSFTEPVLWILQIAAVLELMSHIFRHRETSGKLSGMLFLYYIPAALLVSVIVSLFESLDTLHPNWWLLTAVTVTKWLSWICLFLLVAQELLHLTESQPLRKDLLVHRRLLILYVGITPGFTGLLALLRDTHIGDIANFCSEISWIICLFFWIRFFRPAANQHS